MNSFSLQNFGCRVNQAEAFSWAEAFQRRGLRLEANPGRGDLVVVNTCTLTGRADRDVRRFIRKVHRENPAARLVVTGCLVERARQELEAMAGVWRFIPNSQKENLPELVLGPAPTDKPVRPLTQVQPFRARALLKIQDGCDFRCTFCIIPSVRGRSSSLSPETVVHRLRQLTAGGFQEVVLTGIHLCSYGQDLRPKTRLPELLGRIEQAGLPLRLRLSSLDPRSLDEPMIEALTSSPAVCPHFHLSLQHGSQRLLQRMGRRGGSAAYSRILGSLRERSPQAALGADIIVGFPGETEADFEETREFLERSPLTTLHVFSYSPRPGTPAASRPQVSPLLKKERAAALRRISAAKNLAFGRRFLGREMEAVVVKRTEDGLHLLTANYLSLTAPANGRGSVSPVKVLISEEAGGGLRGEVLS
jgi:threonylcarbamoyladenosine tRNA methylthiotransferase MtaB